VAAGHVDNSEGDHCSLLSVSAELTINIDIMGRSSTFSQVKAQAAGVDIPMGASLKLRFGLNFSSRDNLTGVKAIRVWLLVLLAVLLPLRGALAAAMLCPVADNGVQVELQVVAHTHHGSDRQAVEAIHGHGDGQGGATANHHSADANSGETCNFCSAFCSVPGLVGAALVLSSPQLSSPGFPPLYAPPPSLVLDGQERPPRSI
jgi:hypothetical protein